MSTSRVHPQHRAIPHRHTGESIDWFMLNFALAHYYANLGVTEDEDDTEEIPALISPECVEFPLVSQLRSN
jgi:hypothetical protein